MEAAAASDEQLMVAYAAGDESAFRGLFSRYAPLLARVAEAHLASSDEARDLVQQAFLQLHRARRDYRAGQPFRPWFFTIAYNLLRDRWRAGRRGREVPLESEPPPLDPVTPDADLERRRAAQRLHAALETLPEAQRMVVELHWFAGLPLPEIASSAGISLSAVKVRAHRAYRRLRELLGVEDKL